MSKERTLGSLAPLECDLSENSGGVFWLINLEVKWIGLFQWGSGRGHLGTSPLEVLVLVQSSLSGISSFIFYFFFFDLLSLYSGRYTWGAILPIAHLFSITEQ